MTVEAVFERKSLFGLRKKEIRTVLDYRTWEKEETSSLRIHHSPDRELLNMAKNVWSLDGMKIVQAISENEVVVREYILPPDHGSMRFKAMETIYTREEINEANFQSEDGGLRVVWRDTDPEDYPPLPEGAYIVEPLPIQQTLGLV